MEQKVSGNGKSLRSLVPWLTGAGALLVYLVTLSRWVTSGSLLHVAEVSGWAWQPQLFSPVYWVVTLPLRWLPAAAIPLALNVLSAVCAALVLVLLARSVSLLPQDRTLEQRLRQHNDGGLLGGKAAWIPPVLAALVCGLQLSFWENATAASSEMLSLLLFACVIRCLLEYRVDERDSWLAQAAFVCGLGMSGNWAMVGYFPALLAAMLWIKGLSFVQARFLGRMFLWGLAGLSFYLLLPLVQAVDGGSHLGFWEALKLNLSLQRYALLSGPYNKGVLFSGQAPLWILGLTSVLPVAFMGIRWSSRGTDTNLRAMAVTRFMFRVVHIVFLAACVWVAFDPPFSPRNQHPGLPFLTLYYLGALSVGYFSGYVLLIFGERPARRFPRRTPAELRAFNAATVGGIWALLVIIPAGLLARNLAHVRLTNGPMYRRYAAFMTQSLPQSGAVILSDYPTPLLLLESALTQSGKAKDFLFLQTDALKWPDYQRFLERVRPRSWEKVLPSQWHGSVPTSLRDPLSDTFILNQVWALSRSSPVYYLHPSFGYFFEVFYPVPHGLIYRLEPYQTNMLLAPLPSKAVVAENETFWHRAWKQALGPLLAAISPPLAGDKPGPAQWLMRRAHLERMTNFDAVSLAADYSRALDFWGVERQRAKQLAQAASYFQLALRLNPGNLVAEANLECNRNLQAGQKTSGQVADEAQANSVRQWDALIGANGPYDEPNHCYEEAMTFAAGNNYRQAVENLTRVEALAPDELAPRLWLAHLYNIKGLPDEALKEVQKIHARPDLFGSPATDYADILFVEASAHLLKGDANGAAAAVKKALDSAPADDYLRSMAVRAYLRYNYCSNAIGLIEQRLKANPNDTNWLAVASQAYIQAGDYTNALNRIDHDLSLLPQNATALCNKGFVLIRMHAFEKAIPPLKEAVSLDSTNLNARLNLAVAYLGDNQLEAARKTYLAMPKQAAHMFPVLYGLGEVAYRRRDTNAAIRYYQACLSNAVSAGDPRIQHELDAARARLKELRPGAP